MKIWEYFVATEDISPPEFQQRSHIYLATSPRIRGEFIGDPGNYDSHADLSPPNLVEHVVRAIRDSRHGNFVIEYCTRPLGQWRFDKAVMHKRMSI